MKKLNLNENFISRIWEDSSYYENLKTTDGLGVGIMDYGRININLDADYYGWFHLLKGLFAQDYRT